MQKSVYTTCLVLTHVVQLQNIMSLVQLSICWLTFVYALNIINCLTLAICLNTIFVADLLHCIGIL